MRQRRDKEEDDEQDINHNDHNDVTNGTTAPIRRVQQQRSRRTRRRSQPTQQQQHRRGRNNNRNNGSLISLAPWNTLLPNLLLLFIILFGMGTVLLYGNLVHHRPSDESSITTPGSRISSMQQQHRTNRNFLNKQEKRKKRGKGDFIDDMTTAVSTKSSKNNNKHGDSDKESNDNINDNLIDPTSTFYDQRTWYKQLRDSFEHKHSHVSDSNTIVEFIKTSLDGNHTMIPTIEASKLIQYNIHDCPYDPPPNYPQQYSLINILNHWNPDNVTMPTATSSTSTGDTSINSKTHPIYIGICVFDYTIEGHYTKSLNYRQKEVPFVLRYHPSLLPTVYRWNIPDYMNTLLQSNHLPKQRTESSPTNHFMFWRLEDKNKKRGRNQQRLRKKQQHRQDDNDWVLEQDGGKPYGWQAPTENIEMTYKEWLAKANVSNPIGNSDKHYYFRLNGCPDGLLHKVKRLKDKLKKEQEESNHKGKISNFLSKFQKQSNFEYPWERCPQLYMFDELPYFTPGDDMSHDHLIDTNEYRGINCRFGQTGAIAENHFDMSRNFITVLKGHRRYILSHPNQCHNMALYPKEHPSGRHSIIDWSDYNRDTSWKDIYSNFYNMATANEVILQPGDTLYLPTNWMHYIISLNLNYQCNARSGRTSHYDSYIRDCGFI